MAETAERDHFPKLEHLGDGTPFVGRILEILQHIQMFEDFGHDDIAHLARYLRCYQAPAGIEIIREDEPGDFMLLLIEGEVEIVKKDARGLPARIGLAGPGKTLGEMSVIDGEPRFASCATLADTTFAVLDRNQLSRLVAEEPQIGVKLLMELMMLLNQRLRQVSSRLMHCLEGKRLRLR
ncbi:MAG: cyclic nucleotide-binding domain-containing protein [Rhodocyclaceae bacterium]|nr:cyclic nucleotide-binding domain-containing protein [Rhodocyclaceae bacterium]